MRTTKRVCSLHVRTCVCAFALRCIGTYVCCVYDAFIPSCAGLAYKNGRSYEKAKECFLQAAECYAQRESYPPSSSVHACVCVCVCVCVYVCVCVCAYFAFTD